MNFLGSVLKILCKAKILGEILHRLHQFTGADILTNYQ